MLASETFLENVINGSTPEYELNNMVQSAIETILFGEQQSLEPAPAETFFSPESSGESSHQQPVRTPGVGQLMMPFLTRIRSWLTQVTPAVVPDAEVQAMAYAYGQLW